jgi:predicted metalloprotease with PDZ domain
MKRLTVLFSLACLLATLPGWAGPLKIEYTLAPHPGGNAPASTSVTVRIEGLRGEKSVKLQMAVWSPGDYHVMNHAKYVQDVRAQFEPITGGKSREADPVVAHPDANTWEVPLKGQDVVRVTYSLPNTPPGFFSENVRCEATYAFYNGPATYMYVVGHKSDPTMLQVALPDGWKYTYTPLQRKEARPHTFHAPDFDTLADSPVVAGDIVMREFLVEGRSHMIVFFNRHQGLDYDSVAPTLKKVIETESRTMGGVPYERYGFFLDCGGRGGGLEHLNSFRVPWGRGFRAVDAAGFFAHEFFHLWNVKRIRPAVLGPFDYVDPPKTRNLWFAEGVTSYYGSMSVYRAGFMDVQRLYDSFAGEIGSMQRNPNRLKVTADEASLRVWEAGNSEGFGGISYYQKGELIGLCLDLKLRAVTNGKSSLDHVMRDMLARYGMPKPGFPEDGIRDAVIRAGGESMGPFYDRLCRSTEEMPFSECLAGVGLRLAGGMTTRYSISVDPNETPPQARLRASWLAGSPPDR